MRSICYRSNLNDVETALILTFASNKAPSGQSLCGMEGGEIYVKKIPSMKVTDLARVLAPEAKQKIVGIRPGEKIHEQMIGEEDAYFTYEYPEHFKILPQINGWDADPKRIKDGNRVPKGFVYSSGNNADWMTDDQLRAWIDANACKIGAI